MEYHVLYVEIRKKFEGSRGEKSLGFAESQQKHSTNNVFAESQQKTLDK